MVGEEVEGGGVECWVEEGANCDGGEGRVAWDFGLGDVETTLDGGEGGLMCFSAWLVRMDYS